MWMYRIDTEALSFDITGYIKVHYTAR